MNDTNKERAEFEAWLDPAWSRDTFADDDGDTLYVEDWVQGAWMMFCHNRASLAAKAPAAPTGWYALAADGMATLCVDRDDAEKTAAESEKEWPNCGPFRAVQLYTAPPAPTEQWRGIETAPRDNTRFLAYRPLAHLTHDPQITAVHGRTSDQGCWDETVPSGYDATNFTSGHCKATHWMPIPTPPQGAAKEE